MGTGPEEFDPNFAFHGEQNIALGVLIGSLYSGSQLQALNLLGRYILLRG